MAVNIVKRLHFPQIYLYKESDNFGTACEGGGVVGVWDSESAESIEYSGSGSDSDGMRARFSTPL